MNTDRKEKAKIYWEKMNELARKNGGLDAGWYIGELLGARNGVVLVMYQCPPQDEGSRKRQPQL